jgi:hypothetical protein
MAKFDLVGRRKIMELRKVVPVILLVASCAAAQTPTPILLDVSAPMVAMSSQGRPLAGALVSITDTLGNPQLGCQNSACTSTSTTVNASGIYQFWASPATYNVNISGGGVSRSFVINIPVGATGLDDGDFPGTGFMVKNAPGTYSTVKINLSATTDPGVNDDASHGYVAGSFWVNLNTNTNFVCGNAGIGAAVWNTIGSGVTSINSQAGPAVTIAAGSSGNDFNVAQAANTITINIPSADSTKRGLVSTGTQTFEGQKAFAGGTLIATDGFNAQTLDYTTAVNVVWASDFVGFFSANTALQGYSVFEAPSGSKAAIYAQSDDAGDGVYGQSGSGVTWGIVGVSNGSNSGGGGVLGESVTTGSYAARFVRSVNSSTVPVIQILRNAATDSEQLLAFTDATSTTTAPFIVDYIKNGTQKWALGSNGQITAAIGAVGAPTFSFISDTDSGLTEDSGHIALVADSNIFLYGFYTGGSAYVQATGQLSIGAIASQNGHAVCVKGDGFLGTCSSTPTGGTCTCA